MKLGKRFETINFAENCGADYVKFFIAVPHWHDMYEMARKLNAFEQDHEADNPKLDWRFSQLKSDEWTSKDVSILRVYEWDRINFAPIVSGELRRFGASPWTNLTKFVRTLALCRPGDERLAYESSF